MNVTFELRGTVSDDGCVVTTGSGFAQVNHQHYVTLAFAGDNALSHAVHVHMDRSSLVDYIQHKICDLPVCPRFNVAAVITKTCNMQKADVRRVIVYSEWSGR